MDAECGSNTSRVESGGSHIASERPTIYTPTPLILINDLLLLITVTFADKREQGTASMTRPTTQPDHPSAGLPSYQKIVVHHPIDDDGQDLVQPRRRPHYVYIVAGAAMLLLAMVGFYDSPNAVSMSVAKEDFMTPISSASKSWVTKDAEELLGKSKSKDESKSKKDKSTKEKGKEAKKDLKDRDKAAKKELKHQEKLDKKASKEHDKETKMEEKEEAKQEKRKKKDDEKAVKAADPAEQAKKKYWKDYGKSFKTEWKKKYGKFTPAPVPSPTVSPTYSAAPVASK